MHGTSERVVNIGRIGFQILHRGGSCLVILVHSAVERDQEKLKCGNGDLRLA
jgi:hypothetical protein